MEQLKEQEQLEQSKRVGDAIATHENTSQLVVANVQLGSYLKAAEKTHCIMKNLWWHNWAMQAYGGGEATYGRVVNNNFG